MKQLHPLYGTGQKGAGSKKASRVRQVENALNEEHQLENESKKRASSVSKFQPLPTRFIF
jgi:hypothetical protein